MVSAAASGCGRQRRPTTRVKVAEHALAHQLPDAVERAYQRGSQFAKRTALMTEWAVYCATVQPDAVVKPIRGAA